MEEARLNLFHKGLEFFQEGEHYEAHEIWEEYWNSLEASPYKNHIQGLIQCAAAMHLYNDSRLTGANKVLKRAKSNLEGAPENFIKIYLQVQQVLES